MFETVRLDITEQVATLKLHRPMRRNAWTMQLARELSAALAECDANDGVRAIVVTGAGDCFSVGADLGEGDLGNPGAEQEASQELPRFFPPMCRKPVIAAVNGDAIGAGITFALLCDLRILAVEARVGFVFVRRGVIPEMGGHLTLARQVGLACALDLCLTGRLLSATEAYSLGLATTLLPASQVLAEALRVAADIAANTAPVAVAISKRLLWRDIADRLLPSMDEETELLRWCAQQPDGIEGVASFVERRTPKWTMRPSVDNPPSLEWR